MARGSRMRWRGFGEQVVSQRTDRVANARAVDCPTCEVKAGQHCRDGDGKALPRVHQERIAAAAQTAAISIQRQGRAATRARGEKPATPKQLRYLRMLRQRHGRSPGGMERLTFAQASREIDELKARGG